MQKRRVKSAIIVQCVAAYFHDYPLQVFEGYVHTKGVVYVVNEMLNKTFNMEMYRYNEGEVYDAICEYGPKGEEDIVWLLLWGRDKVDWFAWLSERVRKAREQGRIA